MSLRFRMPLVPAPLLLLLLFGIGAVSRPAHASGQSLGSDFLPEDAPEILTGPVLEAEGERHAEGLARYLQAVLEEESLGPDQALASKRRVLEIDPGFTDLAMEVAHQFLRRGEVPEAISALKDAAKAAPRRVEPPAALAAIYLRQLEKLSLAEKYGLQALAANPDDAAPYIVLHDIYTAANENAKRESLFAKALKRSPASADFWLDLADLRLRNRSRADRDTVELLLDRAQNMAGDNPETLLRVADYFSSIQASERAIPLYQLALALRPSLDGAREKLAGLLIEKGDESAAAVLLEEIIKSDPLSVRAYDRLAEIRLNQKDLPRALSSMRQALLLASPDPRRYDQVIRLSLAAGEGRGAAEAAAEAERHFPGVLEFSFYRALALGQTNQHREAIQVFERIQASAASGRPSLLDADFFFSYGVACEQAGHFDKAAELLQKSISMDAQAAPRACNYLGYMWADRGENLGEAEALIRRALAAEPDNGAYLDSLGWVLFKQGRHGEALSELLRAAAVLSAEPDPVVLEHIGDTYAKLGKPSEAVHYWQKALHLDPESAGLIAKLDAHASRVAKNPNAPAKAGE